LLAITDSAGRLLQTNPRFAQILGTTTAPQVFLQDLLCQDSQRALWRAHIEDTLRGAQTGSGLIALAAIDGRRAWVQASGTALAAGDAPTWLWQMSDMTALRDAQAGATRVSELLELVQSFGRMGIWQRDPQTGEGEWDKHMFHLFGYDTAESAPDFRSAGTRVHPDDQEANRLAFENSLSQPGHHQFRVRILHPDGRMRVGQSMWSVPEMRDGEPRRVVGVILDDTAAYELAQSVSTANELLELATDLGQISVWRHDLKTDWYHLNDHAFAIAGMEPRPEGLSAEALRALVHPDDLAHVTAAAQQALLTGQPTDWQARYRRGDEWRQVMARRVMQRDAQGQPVAFVGVALDLTDAQNAAIAREEREIAYRESRAKSRFLARMSHELRTPLNAVLGFAQLLAIDSHAFDETQRARIGHIRSAGEHLLALIDDVLDLSRLESEDIPLTLEPVDVAQVLEEAMVLLQAQARDMALTVTAGTVDATVLADRTRLRQVLVNLISNAIKYNRPQGQVIVSTCAIGNQQAIRVTDTGRGLSAEQRAHLFEPFNRLGAERDGIEGTGIGLAIVKALVERMQGSLEVSSEPGKGSVFEVRLQAGERISGQPAQALSAAVDRVAGVDGGRLLYIEDNAVNVLLVEELVHSFTRLSIVSEVNGLAGVARARSLLPDLILVDMQLPDIDGFEVLRRLREDPRTAAIRCIALSANAMPEDIARARAAGYSDYWTKPIDVDRFLSALSRLF